MSPLVEFALRDLRSLGDALVELALLAVIFAALARLTAPTTWLADARAASGQTRINLIISIADHLIIAPLLAAYGAWLVAFVRTRGLQLDSPRLWAEIGAAPTLLAAIFVGDFAGYWRHRLQHSKWLWPAHAVHHSDTHLTWLSLERMHPIDRFGSGLDIAILAMLGFPPWAAGANVLVRHFYGYVIHADLPFNNKVGWIFNSPLMHRWHHARDVQGSGSNFATVFSVFDRVFGTYYAPGPCDVALGVREHMGRGVVGQYLHPFRTWGAGFRPGRRARRSLGAAAIADSSMSET